MDELMQWLGGQLDEDERIAQAASTGAAEWKVGEQAPCECCSLVVTTKSGALVCTPDDEDAPHVARHNPARVAREVEAKRELLKEHKPDGWDCSTCAAPETYDDDADGNREWSRDGKSFPCPTLRLLASVYSDRPGYREEWRP